MRLVLDNVGQGFLNLDRAGVIATERSRIVEDWFGPIDGTPTFWDYLRTLRPRAGRLLRGRLDGGHRPGAARPICASTSCPSWSTRTAAPTSSATGRSTTRRRSLDKAIVIITDVTVAAGARALGAAPARDDEHVSAPDRRSPGVRRVLRRGDRAGRARSPAAPTSSCRSSSGRCTRSRATARCSASTASRRCATRSRIASTTRRRCSTADRVAPAARRGRRRRRCAPSWSRPATSTPSPSRARTTSGCATTCGATPTTRACWPPSSRGSWSRRRSGWR